MHRFIATSDAKATPLLLLLLAAAVSALELDGCGNALGMESGRIKDSSISASSAYDSGSVGPQHGRLRNDKHGGAWCPRQMVSRDAREHLEINLEELHILTATKTQGRYGNGQGQEYAEQYMIEYWRPGFAKWVRWKSRAGKELLPGNTNTFSVIEQKLDPPVIASKVRFLPYSDHVRTVCMRVELVGCRWTEGVLSYSMPQGVRKSQDLDLTDRTFDGKEDGGQLSQGLGQLVDGQKGRDNFRLDLAGYGKGYEWVGWRNDTQGWSGLPLEILVEFDRVRNFSAVHLHTNNLFSKEVQVFSHARVFFSLNGVVFSGEPVHFSYMPDLVLEHARNVTIKLHHRLARFLKLQLYFASRWLLLSEISFDSVPVTGNFSEAVPEDAGKEDALQRDEVKPVLKTNRKVEEPRGRQEPKHYIGFVIGVLTVVILILAAAIVFIVFRNQRIKTNASLSSIPIRPDKRVETEKIYSEDKNLYAEAGRVLVHREISDYTDVCRELSFEATDGYAQSSKAPLNFLPKPPPVPPPPDSYCVQSEFCSPLPLESPLRTKIKNHFMLPLSPEPDVPDSPDKVINSFPREQLRIIEKLGEGLFGDVHLCELSFPQPQLVVVHTLRLDSHREDFNSEVRALARLKDPNVSCLLGACLDAQPICAIREYSQHGDLCQFLQDHVAETATPLTSSASSLSYGCLIFMATQIASGMKYLESLKYVHKDLAARNCLVGRKYEIKISDVGSYRDMYTADYYQIPGASRALPIRWMAWESILLGKFSSKSDVWSFAVLLWEILSFAREQPFEDFSDEKVIENTTHFYQNDGLHVLLSIPINCPKEIFDLMFECWQRNESDRPNFREIHLFLQRKNLGYNPDLH